MTITTQAPISEHATANDTRRHSRLGPRVRRLHNRIGQAHHQAEAMGLSRALLEGQAAPRQLAALLRALAPAYALLDELAPAAAAGLGATDLPWSDLARTAALEHDLALVATVPATPDSPAAAAWCARLTGLAGQAPHRLLAHAYVRYGGDLSGGQQLAHQANAIMAYMDLPALSFWSFSRPSIDLKEALHGGIERLLLSAKEEEELMDEAQAAFAASQALLVELASLA
jgi:heme oxygenase